MSRRLFISFSGGRTSGKMTRRLLKALAEPDGEDFRALGVEPYDEVIVLFANTGLEDERTLVFADRCDREFGFGTVWIEAVTDPAKGKGQRARVVTFETASRLGEPFEGVIAKHGIPNRNFPHCTRETKLRPMESYLRSIGWKAGTYDTAIGIRADEADRISVRARENRIIYPLIRWRVTEPEVLAWWRAQSFDLVLPRHLGNCVTCWKKTRRKLLTIAVQDPAAFEWARRMERTYPDAGPGERDRPRRFFRGNDTVETIFEEARLPFTPFTDPAFRADLSDDLDLPGGGCSESCEVHADDDQLELFRGSE